MPRNPDVSSVSRRLFLALAGGAAAANTLAAGFDPEPTQTAPVAPAVADYPVLVDVRTADSVKNRPKYTVRQNDATIVDGVLIGQKFSWQVWTKSHPDNKYHLAVIFKNGLTPFVDANSQPKYAFYGTEQDEGTGGLGIDAKIGPKVTPGEEYDYYVVVFDRKLTQIYVDDPSIIIGDGLIAAEKNLIKASNELKKAASEYALKRDKIRSIEKQLGLLIDELKKP
jgi:hypothetical protein